MGWIIKNKHAGPVEVRDLCLWFQGGQIRDLDIIGRENVERSNDLKILMNQHFLEQIRKDGHSSTSIDPKTVEQLNAAVAKVSEVSVKAAADQAAHAKQMGDIQAENAGLKKSMAEQAELTNKVLSEVQEFAKKFPADIKTFSEAMRNIVAERQAISEKREELAEAGVSEAEIKVADRILSLKDKKLEKNLENLGKTVSGSAADVKGALDAMDELGL
jgi:hypothetical protein